MCSENSDTWNDKAFNKKNGLFTYNDKRHAKHKHSNKLKLIKKTKTTFIIINIDYKASRIISIMRKINTGMVMHQSKRILQCQ